MGYKIGHKHSEETREKLSLSRKGNTNCVGRKYSKETIEKMRLARLGKPSPIKGVKKTIEHRMEMSRVRKGKKMSLETRLKMSESRKGKNNPSYKGGVTPLNQRIRRSMEMRLWKKAVLERDNFTCQKTGQVGGKLVAHHICNFADFPELRTSIDNGITLSKESHIKFHKKYGRKNNTRSQLEEFIIN